MIAKVLGISQPAVSGVIKRSGKWVIIITWPLISGVTLYRNWRIQVNPKRSHCQNQSGFDHRQHTQKHCQVSCKTQKDLQERDRSNGLGLWANRKLLRRAQKVLLPKRDTVLYHQPQTICQLRLSPGRTHKKRRGGCSETSPIKYTGKSRPDHRTLLRWDSRADQGTDEFLQVYHPTNNADEKSSGVACIQKGWQLCHQIATQLH